MSPNHEQDLMNLNSDAIVRVTSYPRKDFNKTVILPEPGQHDNVRSSCFKALGTSGSSGLGRLKQLPLELISSICLCLDVRSAWNFNQASRSSREIIASIPQYRQLGEHALDCLWALFWTRVAAHVDILALHSTLLTERCVICSSFGGYIFLPTVSRCCIRCIETAPALQVVSSLSLYEISGLPTSGAAWPHPVVYSIPGTYSLAGSRQRDRVLLVSGQHALEFLREHKDEDPQTTLSMVAEHHPFRYMASTLLPFYSVVTGESQLGRSCTGCQIAMEANFCYENLVRREHVYSREEFISHFQDCAEAKARWLSSEGGTIAVEEPDWFGLDFA